MMAIGKTMVKTTPVVLAKAKESMLIRIKPLRKSRRRIRPSRPSRPQMASWLTRKTFQCRLVSTLLLEHRETIELTVMTIMVLSRPMSSALINLRSRPKRREREVRRKQRRAPLSSRAMT